MTSLNNSTANATSNSVNSNAADEQSAIMDNSTATTTTTTSAPNVASTSDTTTTTNNLNASATSMPSKATSAAATSSTDTRPEQSGVHRESLVSERHLTNRRAMKLISFHFVLQLLTKPRLQELVREIDPTEQLDEEVEELLLQIADDFVENTVNAACLLAKHRKVSKVEVKDVQLHLERNWNMWIPGFGTDELRPYKRATVTEAHKQRLALIRKAIKKY